MTDTERWLPIINTGARYEVSSMGRVRNCDGKLLSLKKKKNGYVQVHLSVNGNETYPYVGRLVCQAFHGPPPNIDCHADHINGQRDFNEESNLRWLSPNENRKLRKTAKGERRPDSKLTDEAVRLIRNTNRNGQELSDAFGVCRQTISKVRNRRSWKHV